MVGVPFVRGPYDGANFTFADRLPEEIHLLIDCLDADASDPKFQEALRVNLPGAESDGLVVARNIHSITAHYCLDTDEDGAPWYRYAGWSARGVESSSGSS